DYYCASWDASVTHIF
nr:immunoglobulin light chain junction region [Macaca mulatta]